MNAEIFFSEDEKKQIAMAIADVEKKTSGEVAVMLVDRSDTYPEGRIIAGLLAGCTVALFLTQQFFNESLWYFIPLAAALSFLFGWAIIFSPPLFRYFIPAARLESEVQERALRAFYEKELYRTRDKTGVLFFLSLFEHRVWVLADSGIYSKINPEELQEYARDIAQGMKQGNACHALCREIERVGKVLAENFPLKAGDTNELGNELIIGT